MDGTERPGGQERGIEACRAALEAHVAEHRTVPSMAGLARLWGYASKSSASRRVDQLIAAGVLVWSADRRLAPGPAFRGEPWPAEVRATPVPAPDAPGADTPVAAGRDADPLPAALTAWAGYEPQLVRAYSMTTRLLRLAQAMERGIARSASTEGLTSGELHLLDALYRVGPPHRIAPTALKRYFLMSLAGVAKRVDRLEALGFIERVPNPDDRRGLFIQLTEAGRAALRRLVKADGAAPHIIWPLALSERQYRVTLESLEIAEAMVAGSEGDKNDRS